MKKITLVLLLFFNINAFAQRQEAFFSSDSAGLKNIANLIIENAKNKYFLEKVIPQKQNVEFLFRYDPHTLIRIHFQALPDETTRPFILKGVTGNYEDIFPFWKKYFQEDADTGVIEKAGSVKSTAISFSKGEIVYSFRRLANPLWQIKPFSLVASTTK